MTLCELTALYPGSLWHGSNDPVIARVDYDSRQVQPGSLFVAISGQKSDGLLFLGEAKDRGAVAAVVEKMPSPLPDLPLVEAPSTRRALAIFAGAVAGHPDRELTLVGITGTNGKTTTALLLADMLAEEFGECGLISTVGTRIGKRWQKADRTTPEVVEVYALLREMREQSCSGAVLEVSSHALELERVFGLRFAVAAFTNLTQDHLDFHGSMEAYFAAKAKLFCDYDIGAAVINADDAYGQKLMSLTKKPCLTYSLELPSDVKPSRIKLSNAGIAMQVETPRGAIEIDSPLLGRFNAYNLLCAVGVAETLQFSQAALVKTARAFSGARGRMQRFDLHDRWVFVDYAHTPDALRQVLEQLRELAPGPVHILFGCGGNRDKAKRPLMGRIAEELANQVYVTTDNPRDEEPLAIAEDILSGMAKPAAATLILDRRTAIRQAISDLPLQGTLLIAGKGHEDYQEIRGKKHHFDDSEEVRRFIRSSR